MHVFLLVLDCLRKDSVGFHGESSKITENIDAFAGSAQVHGDVVSQAPWTLPSHVSMLTGKYPWVHGATQRSLEVGDDRMLQQELSEKGFETAVMSENGFLKPHTGITEGFSVRYPEDSTFLDSIVGRFEDYFASSDRGRVSKAVLRFLDRLHHSSGSSSTEDILSRCLSFAESNKESFALVNLMDAHEPYFPSQKYRKVNGAPEPTEVEQTPQEFYGDRKPDSENLKSLYEASVDEMDDLLGAFFSDLKNRGLWSDSMIILTSDHGQLFNEEFYGHQFSVSEDLVEVPFAVKMPEDKNLSGDVRELKQVRDLVIQAAENDSVEASADSPYLGGYDFPQMMRNRVPSDKMDEMYVRYTYGYKEDGAKQVLEERRETGFDFRSDGLLKDRLKDVSWPGDQSEGFESKDEEVKDQLRDLGYG